MKDEHNCFKVFYYKLHYDIYVSSHTQYIGIINKLLSICEQSCET